MLKLLLILLISIETLAAIHETPTLNSCLSLAEAETTLLSPAEVVYVFDIDNTALKLKNNFGSVQWFQWQRKLIQDNSVERITDTIDELLAIQSSIYQLSSTSTPESTTAVQIAHLQELGHPVIFHTSRNLDTRESTARELKQNGLIPLTNTLGPANGYAGVITYQNAPSPQRPVSFQDGVYMSAGQDKGVWLNFLFEKLQYKPKHIVFVDDESKNLVNVERALQNVTPGTLCRYGQVDPVVQAFNASNKSTETAQWHLLESLLKQLK